MPWTMNSGNMWKLSCAMLLTGLTACITVESPPIPTGQNAVKQDAGAVADDDDTSSAVASGTKEDEDASVDAGVQLPASCERGPITGASTQCVSANKPCTDACGGFFYACLDGDGMQPQGLHCYKPSADYSGACCLEHVCVRYSSLDNKCSYNKRAFHCDADTQRPADCVAISGNPGYVCCPR